ncbi:hypothetical protein GQ43DRAFT_480036 [Delitschia confertaspora ATCC 74209]|uniref:Uncharacterized protein n=1 Tax=Delitschia confertaspora ATCC 74209 TaxID=1513339 RepID=A0A9P4MT88_9PLEO|nr:hypothetical protein GQ43DRAFT_480036 [Delitschia confertaspora ATCC 74209]
MQGSAVAAAFGIATMNMIFHCSRWLIHAIGPNPKFEPINSSTIWLHIALTLDYAIEFPLFLVFHPSTLLYHCDVFSWATLPGPSQLILQLGVFFLVESALQKCVLDHVDIFSAPRPKEEKEKTNVKYDEDRLAARIVFDFIRPRATLLIVTWLLAGPRRLTAVTGPAHVTSMAWWVVLQQAVEWDGGL